MLELRGIGKTYQMGSTELVALADINLKIARNEYVALIGPSGSGKSTMMNVLGCLDLPSTGTYTLDGEPVAGLSEDQLARVRNRKIGFIFQSYYLMPRTTIADNVAQPLIYRGLAPGVRRERANAALASGSKRAPCTNPTSCPAGSGNAWPLPGRSWAGRTCCLPMNRRATWTAKPRSKSWASSATCMPRA
jgi:ABC-type lipoprotein export system ATPase subunit